MMVPVALGRCKQKMNSSVVVTVGIVVVVAVVVL